MILIVMSKTYRRAFKCVETIHDANYVACECPLNLFTVEQMMLIDAIMSHSCPVYIL